MKYRNDALTHKMKRQITRSASKMELLRWNFSQSSKRSFKSAYTAFPHIPNITLLALSTIIPVSFILELIILLKYRRKDIFFDMSIYAYMNASMYSDS